MAAGTTYADLFDLIDSKWEARYMGTLAISSDYRDAGEQDKDLTLIVSQLATYVREQTMDEAGNVYCDQQDANDNSIDTITDDEMARRIVDALDTLLNG